MSGPCNGYGPDDENFTNSSADLSWISSNLEHIPIHWKNSKQPDCETRSWRIKTENLNNGVKNPVDYVFFATDPSRIQWNLPKADETALVSTGEYSGNEEAITLHFYEIWCLSQVKILAVVSIELSFL